MLGETVGFWLIVLVALMLAFGLPVATVGVVLRLCEWSWPKPAGSLGSRGLLIAGGLLSLPAVLCLAQVALKWL
jgi:hypothetical protein